MTKLYLVRGLPGSGKTTFANTIGAEIDARVYEADQWMVNSDGVYEYNPSHLQYCHRMCLSHTRASLLREESVIVANTFTRIWEMQSYFDLAHELDIPCEVFVCPKVHPNIHRVPEETIKRMADRWEILDVETVVMYNVDIL